MTFDASIKRFAFVLVLAAAGCAGVQRDGREEVVTPQQLPTPPEEPVEEPAPESTPSTATPCDEAIAEAWDDVSALLSDAYLAAIDACVAQDHSPVTCVVLALGDLEPTPAHHELAESFCDECAFGVPGCEQLFYFEEDEPIGLGIVALPFSDELVVEIADECADGITCAVDFVGCARDVIRARVEPDAAIECLLDAVGG